MAMATFSHKSAYREEGNRLYKRAHADGVSLNIRKILLTKAIANYEKAAPFASGDEDEKASIEKNLGLAHFAISSLDHVPPPEMAERKRDALKFMGAALKRVRSGATKKDAQWAEKVEELTQKILTSGVEKVAELARETADDKKTKVDEKNDSSRRGGREKSDDDDEENIKSSSSEENVSTLEWVRFFYVLIEPVEPKSRLVQPYLDFAKHLFHYAVRARESGDFKDALYFLEEMALPLGEAERLSRETPGLGSDEAPNNNNDDSNITDDGGGWESEVADEVRLTREEVTMEKSIAEAMSAIRQGGDLLTIAILDEETPNMSLIFDAMDWFKNAAVKARGYDMEQEAIACHHVGRIFEKVIKLKGKAKEYYMQVMSLTEACKPRTFYGKSWYYDTTASLQEFQREAARRDDAEKQKQRQVYLDQLKDEIAALKEADGEDVYELVGVIIEKFPPKVKVKKFKDFDKKDLDKCKEMEAFHYGKLKVEKGEQTPWEKYKKDYDSMKIMKKKLLLKFLSDYHPDRNPEKDFGKKWQVLAEEITKMITRYYERMK